MDRLGNLQKYFHEKQRKRLDAQAEEDGGLPRMTPEELRQTCLENEGYEAPELNDRLFLHFRGFRCIENLEPYTQVKAMWLDSNGLTTIERINHMSLLRCLYLGKNLISKIQGKRLFNRLAAHTVFMRLWLGNRVGWAWLLGAT